MGGFKAALATVICHLVSSLIHKSGTLVRHARRVVGDLHADLWGGLAARKMSTSCQRSNAASSEVRDSSSLVSAPQAGKSGKLTGCNQKRKARTDPRSDVLHMQVIWEAVLLLLVLCRASSALVFRDGLLHRLAGGVV